MTRTTSDPLLGIARALVGLFIGLMILVIVLVCIGVAAVLTVQRAELAADIAAAGLAPAHYWMVVLGLVAVVVMLVLALRFASELGAIVVSVEEGDPFIAQNAERLARMGWLALSIQAIGLPIGMASAYLHQAVKGSEAALSISGSGILLVLILFILARVFRKGTEMREELAGTV